MSAWIDVALADEFVAGDSRLLEVENVSIAVFNIDGEFYAIEDLCSHEHFAMLGSGLETGDLVKGTEIMCPRHGARFCLKTGAALCPPAYEALSSFPVRLKNGMVQLGIDQEA